MKKFLKLNPASIIFDLDGVIIDTERHFKKIDHQFLAKIVPGWSPEDQRSIWGMSIDDVYQKLFTAERFSGSRASFLAHYERLSEQIFGMEVELFPDVRKTLETLSKSIPLALCSSAPHRWIDLVLKRFQLENYFRAIVSAEDVENLPKPSPRIYQHAVERLNRDVVNCAGADCIAIEDTEKGIKSALGAGIPVILYRNGMNDSQEAAGAIAEVSDLRDLLNIFGKNVLSEETPAGN